MFYFNRDFNPNEIFDSERKAELAQIASAKDLYGYFSNTKEGLNKDYYQRQPLKGIDFRNQDGFSFTNGGNVFYKYFYIADEFAKTKFSENVVII